MKTKNYNCLKRWVLSFDFNICRCSTWLVWWHTGFHSDVIKFARCFDEHLTHRSENWRGDFMNLSPTTFQLFGFFHWTVLISFFWCQYIGHIWKYIAYRTMQQFRPQSAFQTQSVACILSPICTWRTISYNMAAEHAKCATFGLTFTNAVKNFTNRSMEISLTLSKIVLLLLKCPYVRMSPNPVLRKDAWICLWTVYFPNSQRIATSKRRWNFVLFRQHPPYIFSKMVK